MEDLLLLEEFDPFTPKRPLVASLHLDTEKESDTGHHSRMTTERPYPDDTATTTFGSCEIANNHVFHLNYCDCWLHVDFCCTKRVTVQWWYIRVVGYLQVADYSAVYFYQCNVSGGYNGVFEYSMCHWIEYLSSKLRNSGSLGKV